jgi:hypothetical protein
MDHTNKPEHAAAGPAGPIPQDSTASSPSNASDQDTDFDDNDSAYGDSIDGSDTTSIKSVITKYRYENGRRYHAYRDGAYWAPNDELHNDQQDIAHHLWLLTLDNKLYLAPITDPHVSKKPALPSLNFVTVPDHWMFAIEYPRYRNGNGNMGHVCDSFPVSVVTPFSNT